MSNATLEIPREDGESAKSETPKEQVNAEVKALVEHVKDQRLAQRYFEENPFAVLAVAAGVGYILGGGLLSPFSRRIARIGMKAMVLPIAASQLKSMSGVQEPEQK